MRSLREYSLFDFITSAVIKLSLLCLLKTKRFLSSQFIFFQCVSFQYPGYFYLNIVNTFVHTIFSYLLFICVLINMNWGHTLYQIPFGCPFSSVIPTVFLYHTLETSLTQSSSKTLNPLDAVMYTYTLSIYSVLSAWKALEIQSQIKHENPFSRKSF